jgi:presenilin-like A22 family membrane protease
MGKEQELFRRKHKKPVGKIMKFLKLSPFIWGGLIMLLSLTLAFFVASQEKVFLETNQIVPPSVSLGPVIIYFFGVLLVMVVLLFLIPLSKQRLIFRVLFTLMFAWGMFIILAFLLPQVIAISIAILAGIAWLFWDRIWLHNLLLLVTLASAGSVFGFLFSPLTFMIFMLIIAVYDFLAVRFGFMVWMADKLSETTTLPAFILPRKIEDWAQRPDKVQVGDLKNESSAEREYAILGGGDIGFPLVLTVSVFFVFNLNSAIFVGVFALAGLLSAFLVQALWLKGKPMPALPPIALFSLIGFLIASRFLR